jgi:phosphate acetyltransferase
VNGIGNPAQGILAPLDRVRGIARANPRHIILSEGLDPHVQQAAVRAAAQGLARVTVIGPASQMPALPGVACIDPATSPHREALCATYMGTRAKRHPTAKDAVAALDDPLMFAALMVRAGLADGTISGAVATTSKTVRAAMQVIGTAPDAPLVSSFFLMVLPDTHPTRPCDALIFSDCGLVIDPSAEEMAAIAVQSAASARLMLGHAPRVAMLSFSTKGSARHKSVNKVIQATDIARASGLNVDGELQFDAAFVAEIGASKAPGSTVAGHADVFIFPNLDAGNIGYKIAQRIGGATAIGPVLQGLMHPANDLSRGCTAQDIVDMIAVTAVQAGA